MVQEEVLLAEGLRAAAATLWKLSMLPESDSQAAAAALSQVLAHGMLHPPAHHCNLQSLS